MANDVSELIGWKCSCGQAGNMGKFCFSCGKVQPLVGAQRAVPEQIAATVEDKASRVVKEEPVIQETAKTTESVSQPASAVSEYFDYSGEGSGAEEKAEDTGASDTVYVEANEPIKAKGLGIAGMVTGIVSCALCLVPVVGVASGTCGMIMTIKAKDQGNLSAFTKAGTICSAIGCSVGFIMLIKLFI